MPLALLKYGLSKVYKADGPFTVKGDLKPSYDVVIVGGGGHGLATAYYLAKEHGITNVAVIEKNYIGGGNTARNTTVVRSNYLTPEGVRFYDASVKLFRNLSNELNYNVMLSERGQLTLAHNDSTLRSFRWRAEVNKELGVRSEVVDLQTVRELVPMLNTSSEARYPILGGLWHKDGAAARHDAVAWGYAKRAAEMGVDIYQKTEVTGFKIEKGKVVGVKTTRGDIACGKVVQAVAGMSSRVAEMAGIRLPIKSFPLQAMVTTPVKPFLDPLVSSAQLHCYVSQSARGELVIGGGSDPYPLYSTRSTLDLKEGLIAHAVEMFPFIAKLGLMRQWAGITDMTPDYSPIMGLSPVENYYLDAGWGTWGFKATPITGQTMAHTIATGQPHELIKPFSLERFFTYDLVNEMGATAASH